MYYVLLWGGIISDGKELYNTDYYKSILFDVIPLLILNLY